MSIAPQSRLVAERYRLVEPLGEGGMGRVWRARDEVLHRDVAIKELVLPPALTTEERQELRERSMREARAIARLSHVNVVRIFDVVSTDGDPWIVMEYIPSRSLQHVLTADGPVGPQRAAHVGLSILGALEAAHQAGVLHRDVKPANVLLADDGRVVLTDFGLATVHGDPTVTRAGLVLGSPAYIAPERARDGTATPEGDLWSLGATLHAAVEGRSPYGRESAMATLAALAVEPPPPPRHAGPLKPVIAGLLRRDPATRIGPDEARRLLLRAAGRRDRRGPAFALIRRTRTEGPPADRPAAVVPSPREPAPPPEPAVAPPSTVEGPARGVAAVITRAPREPGSQRRTVIGATLAAAVAILVLLVVLLPGGERGPRGGAAPPASPSAAASQTPAAPPTTGAPTTAPPTTAGPPSASPTGLVLPSGWHMYHDRTGFAVAVPVDWTVSRDRTIVYFRDPRGGRLLGIDQSDTPKADPYTDWLRQEEYRVARGDWNEYELIGIRRVEYRDYPAADWEFRYTSDRGTRIHVINRNFITAPDQAHAIYWSTPDSTWTQNLDDFALITNSFQPVR
ncbi:MAG TPA: serine/threonine-protein kinase [Micromonosporaceae bacterium]|nr:serine/threonine-protein kinase [Micromonosporaceae bacterium]